jgi:hypothetical protein
MENNEPNRPDPGVEQIEEGRGVAMVFGLIPFAAVLGTLLLLVTLLAPAYLSGLALGIGLALVLMAGVLYIYQSQQRGRGRS